MLFSHQKPAIEHNSEQLKRKQRRERKKGGKNVVRNNQGKRFEKPSEGSLSLY